MVAKGFEKSDHNKWQGTFCDELMWRFYDELDVTLLQHYAIRSRKVIVGNWTCDIFNFSIWLKCSFGEVPYAENLTWIGPVVPKLGAIEGFSKH